LVCNVARNADAASAVADSPRALVHGAGFVQSRHSRLVEFAVHRHVSGMVGLQFGARVHDCIYGIGGPHRIGGFGVGTPHRSRAKIGVAARPVPAPQRFGMKGRAAPVLLRDAQKDVARHPQLVRDLKRRQRADLELPLRRRHLRICAANGYAGVQARLQVLVRYFTTETAVAAHAAVIRARAAAPGVPRAGPLIRNLLVAMKENVLLLNAEQGLVGYTRSLGLRASGAGIRDMRRCAVLVIRITQHQISRIRNPKKWVGIHGDGANDDIAVGSCGLPSG